MAVHNELGKKGEQAAVNYLRRKGYSILEQNWTCHKYEIDIIAQDGDYLVFVEVKTRSSCHWGNPEEAVSKTRMKRMVEAADFYIKEKDMDVSARFDVIAVISTGRGFDIDHFDDAFLASVD